jgi:hypothetical protein
MIRKIALIAALGLTASVGAHADTVNLALDGFCNTFTLTDSGFTLAGTRQGCGYTDIDGGSIAKINGTRYAIANDTNDQLEIFTWYFTLPADGAGSWQLYRSDGVSSVLFNAGTYTVTSGSEAKTLLRPGKDVTAH